MNIFTLSEDELLLIVYICFLSVISLDDFPIEKARLKKFIFIVRNQYFKNPYHNFTHAVDVLQSVYYFIIQLRKKITVSPWDTLGLLLAAFCHDIGHPGCNNYFMNTAETTLSTIFIGKSVLEQYHVMILLYLLNDDNFSPFSSISYEKVQDLKILMKECILATDMALHFEYISQLKELIEKNTISSFNLTPDRTLLYSCILKCADISNTARPFHIHSQWVRLLVEEYIAQGNVEKTLGLPIHIFGNPSTFSRRQLQLDFCLKYAIPLFELMDHFMSDNFSFVKIIKENVKLWLESPESEFWIE